MGNSGMALEHAHFQFSRINRDRPSQSKRATARQHTSHEPCESVHPLANTKIMTIERQQDCGTLAHTASRSGIVVHRRSYVFYFILLSAQFFPRMQQQQHSSSSSRQKLFQRKENPLLFNVNNKIEYVRWTHLILLLFVLSAQAPKHSYIRKDTKTNIDMYTHFTETHQKAYIG